MFLQLPPHEQPGEQVSPQRSLSAPLPPALIYLFSFSFSGLGLSICKQLVELFKGTINVGSQIGGGTSFRFSVELQLPTITSSLSVSQEFLPRITTQSVLRNVFPREAARVLVASQSARFSSLITSLLGSVGFLNCTLLSYTSRDTLAKEYGEMQGRTSFDAILLYCNDGADAVDTTQLVVKLTDVLQLVVVSPSLTQPIRKKLTSLGIRHLGPPLSEAKLRRYLAAVLFSSEQDDESGRTPRIGQSPRIALPSPKKHESQQRSTTVLAAEV